MRERTMMQESLTSENIEPKTILCYPLLDLALERRMAAAVYGMSFQPSYMSVKRRPRTSFQCLDNISAVLTEPVFPGMLHVTAGQVG